VTDLINEEMGKLLLQCQVHIVTMETTMMMMAAALPVLKRQAGNVLAEVPFFQTLVRISEAMVL